MAELGIQRASRTLPGGPLLSAVPGRHVYFLSFIVVLTLAYFFASVRSEPVQSALRDEEYAVTIAIDAGHGGPDPGAVGVAGTFEKDVTLAIALKLEQALQGMGYRTLMTRTNDADLVAEQRVPHRQRADLIARAELVNASDAVLLVSLHANSSDEPVHSGAQTYFLDGDEAGRSLAVTMQNALVRGLAPNGRRVSAGDLRILHDVHVPAVVIEVGFLTNPQEEKLLIQEVYQERVARAVAEGIQTWLQEQRRVNALSTAPGRPSQ